MYQDIFIKKNLFKLLGFSSFSVFRSFKFYFIFFFSYFEKILWCNFMRLLCTLFNFTVLYMMKINLKEKNIKHMTNIQKKIKTNMFRLKNKRLSEVRAFVELLRFIGKMFIVHVFLSYIILWILHTLHCNLNGFDTREIYVSLLCIA